MPVKASPTVHWPVTPILPGVVSDGDKVLASHENTQSQFLDDLWTNLQTLNPWAFDVDAAGHSLVNADAVSCASVRATGDVNIDGQYLVGGVPLGVGGSSASVFFYKIDGKATAPNDPGAGTIRYNNSVQPNATSLYVDVLTADGLDTLTLFSMTGPPDQIIIQEKGISQSNQIWRQTAPVILYPDWFEVPVAFVSGGGAGGTGFNDKKQVAVILAKTTAGQTPWGQDIDAAGYSLLNGGPVFSTGVTVTGDVSISGDVVLPGLPSADPGAGSNKLWYDPADGNRVKFAA